MTGRTTLLDVVREAYTSPLLRGMPPTTTLTVEGDYARLSTPRRDRYTTVDLRNARGIEDMHELARGLREQHWASLQPIGGWT